MVKKIQTDLKIEKLLTSWGIIVIVWSIFRSNFFPPMWFSELIAKPLIFLLPVYWYVKGDKKKGSILSRLGFPKKGLWREIGLTILLMLLIAGFGLISIYTSSNIKVLFVNRFDLMKIGTLFLLAIASAFSEEIVGRGFLFNYLYKYSKHFLLSLFVSSTLFFILYLPGALTLNLGGQDLLLNLILNFALSFITGISFYMRKNIVPAIGVHAMIVFWLDLLISTVS